MRPRHLGQGENFQDAQGPQSARFTFSDTVDTKEAQWSDGPITDLQGVDIYDTTCGLIYVNDENETTYEPWLLRLFTRLTDSCTTLSKRINDRINGLVSKKPDLPPEWVKADAGAWYQGVSAATTSNSVDDKTAWTSAHEKELGELNKRLAEANPAAMADLLRRRKKSLLELKNELQVCLDRLLDEPCEKYMAVKADAAAKRRAANEDRKRFLRTFP